MILTGKTTILWQTPVSLPVCTQQSAAVTDYALEYIVLHPTNSPHSVVNLSSYTLLIGLLLLIPRCRVLHEQLTGLQLVKKFPAFHGTRRFITALISVCHLSILGQPNPVHIPTSHLLEIHPNIIHPSTPRSHQWSLHPYASHAQPISFFSILSPAQYWERSTDHLAPRYAISSSPPLPCPS